MGMFDNIRCELPLPVLGEVPERVFQTKDTPAQYLDTYVIRADGEFVHESPDIEDLTEEEREAWAREHGYADTKWAPIMRRVGEPRRVEWTGEVYFYDSKDQKGWIEFKATIVRGKLDGDIELIEDSDG